MSFLTRKKCVVSDFRNITDKKNTQAQYINLPITQSQMMLGFGPTTFGKVENVVTTAVLAVN